jgi:hypothetical protein
VAKGRIPKIYLADAAIELGFVASWLFERSAIARGR